MAATFLGANQDMTMAVLGYNKDGAVNQEQVREALFELMRHCEDIRMGNGEAAGPFETVEELTAFIGTYTAGGGNHLLVREYEGGAAHLVEFDADGNIKNYTAMAISPETYLRNYGPEEVRGNNVPRTPNAWDRIVDFFKSIVGGRDEDVVRYEQYQAKCREVLKQTGFEKPAEEKKTEEDIELEATGKNADVYKSKEEQKLEGAENLISDEDFADEVSPKEKELQVIRNILRPETFGYKPTKNLSDIMYQYMPVIANGDDLPEELDGTRLGAEFEAYRNFAQTVYDLADGSKEMRDAFAILNKKGLLSKLYESYKEEFNTDNKLDIGAIMQEAISGNKTNLTKAVNKEPIMGHKTPINNSFAQPTGNSMGKG